MSGAAPPPSLVTALADRYRLRGELGRGATATVYLADDLKHGRPVAIKVLDPELARAIGSERFRREIEIAARLNHPHVLPLFDSGDAGGYLYSVMPYIAGESLRARLVREPQLPLDDALTIAREVAEGLAHAHEHGLVHRDVKPENILLSSGHAQLADFGISRVLGAGLPTSTTILGPQTGQGVSLGTPLYMAPEQFAASPALDGRADVYSLGCVLFEMLAGEPPFGGADVASIQARHALDPVPPLGSRRRGIPEGVVHAVEKALAKAPADRFADARRFAEALAEAGRNRGGQPPVAAPAGWRPGRRALGVLVAGILVVAAAVGAWRAGWLARIGAPASPSGREWVFLADFEGPADDPTLARAARDLLAAAIDESDRISAVAPEQVAEALRLAGRPDSTRITVELARELAIRSSIRVVIDGALHRVGRGYSIVLRAVDAESGRPVVSVSGAAKGEEDVVPMIDRASADLRGRLGENLAAIAQTRPLIKAATPSLAAYRLYADGLLVLSSGDSHAARKLFTSALGHDSSFALASLALATTYSNRGDRDSARWALGRAMAFADRLGDFPRYDAQAKLARLDFDFAAAMAAYDRALQLDLAPDDRATMLNNRATLLSQLGRHEEALAAYREALRLEPIRPTQLMTGNVVGTLVALDRLEEARGELAKLRGVPYGERALEVGLLARDFGFVDSLGAAILADEARHLASRLQSGIIGALARAGCGQFEAAAADLRAMEPRVAALGGPMTPFPGTAGMLLAKLEGRPTPVWARGAEPNPMVVFFFTHEGDSAWARAAARRWAAELPPSHRADHVAAVEGLLAYRERRWSEAIAGLGPLARRGEPLLPGQEVVRRRARWLMADAFEAIGQPDSAATYLESIVSTGPWSQPVLTQRTLYEPFARARLVDLAIARGRHDEARAHWEAMLRVLTRPDARARRLLEETRVRLQVAGALGSTPSR